MKNCNYIKKRVTISEFDVLAEELKKIYKIRGFVRSRRSLTVLGLFVSALICSVLFISSKNMNPVTLCEEISPQIVTLPVASVTTKKSVITVPSGMIKANPFLPYRDIEDNTGFVNDVPVSAIISPPSSKDYDSDAVRVMDTMVSGILFDKFNPSAILNIEGNDYLVKKGDVINNYKVLLIAQDSVTVQLGANVYKAGIGEILTEGSITHNEVSNLNNKFGGVRQ